MIEKYAIQKIHSKVYRWKAGARLKIGKLVTIFSLVSYILCIWPEEVEFSWNENATSRWTLSASKGAGALAAGGIHLSNSYLEGQMESIMWPSITRNNMLLTNQISWMRVVQRCTQT